MPDDPTTTPQPADGDDQTDAQTPAAPTADDNASAPAPPVVPQAEAIQAVEEQELRDAHAALEEWRVAARDRRDVDGVRMALAEQERIAVELTRRIEVERQTDEALAALDEQAVAALPDAADQVVGAGASAAQLAGVGPQQTPAEQAPPAAARTRPRVALQASAGTDVVSAGSEVDFAILGASIEQAKRGRSGKTYLASIDGYESMEATTPGSVPPILSVRNGTPVNDELIRSSTEDWQAMRAGPEAVEARQAAVIEGTSGPWFCEPFDNIRDIPDAFVTTTPVADMFPSRGAGRGGFNFTPSAELADVLGSVNLWGAEDQANVDPDDSSTWKPCIDYDCPDYESAVLEAITTCVTFPITLEMSNPERVANLNNAVNALEARVYEGRILQRVDQLSHAYAFSGDYGALPTLIEAVNTVVAQLTFANRQQPGNYDVIIPPGLVQALAIDRANKGYNSDETAKVLSILQANLEGTGNIVYSLDASLGGEPGIPFAGLGPIGGQNIAPAPDYLSGKVWRVRIVDPAAAIYAETGEMNAGVLRDANMIRQNKSGYFRERFFFLAKHGPQPWATIDVELCADGARAGLRDPAGCLVS